MKVYTLEYRWDDIGALENSSGTELIGVFDSEAEAREVAENRDERSYYYDYVIKEFEV